MRQGVLKEAKPNIVNGVHKNFTGTHGTFYKFNLLFEDGIKGYANSKTREGTYSVGSSYTYDLNQDAKGNMFIKNLKKVDASGAPAGGNNGSQYKSYYDDPAVQRQITRAFCATQASIHQDKLPEEERNSKGVKMLYDLFKEFVYGASEPKQMLIRRQGLEIALNCMPYPGHAIDEWVKLLSYAEKFSNLINKDDQQADSY